MAKLGPQRYAIWKICETEYSGLRAAWRAAKHFSWKICPPESCGDARVGSRNQECSSWLGMLFHTRLQASRSRSQKPCALVISDSERRLIQCNRSMCVAVSDYYYQVLPAALAVSKKAKIGQAETPAYHNVSSQQLH
jgi:hypothetical protein